MCIGMADYKNRKYIILPYDPKWVIDFESYAIKLRPVFPRARIEHIGSTSVPGMFGKPTIDLLVTVEDINKVEEKVSDMEQIGFSYAGEFVMPHTRLFRVMRENELLANIHFFPHGHSHVAEMIRLRDYLRSEPNEVKAYSKLKEDLAEKYSQDYASYRKNKDEYVAELMKRVVVSTREGLSVKD